MTKLQSWILLGSIALALLISGTAPTLATPGTYLVTSTADSGPGTLRQALLDAGPGTISFDPAVFPAGGNAVIWILSPLPAISTNSVTLDASNAGVTLDGSRAPAGANGLVIDADSCGVQGLTIRGFKRAGIIIMAGASGNTVGGNRSAGSGPNGQGNTIIANGGDGVEITGAGADNNAVWGNHIGVDRAGVVDAGNTWSGVAIKNGARGNSVGDDAAGYGNVISGNDYNGVWIGGAGTEGNQVIGNRIGTRADGLAALPNGQSGVSIPNGAANNRIGGTGAGEGNLISGNRDFGVFIADPGTSGNQVLGNLIGPDRNGNVAIGQGLGGIIILNGASGNFVGDGTSAGRNVISGNTYDGIHILGSATANNIVKGNFIGSNASGTAALPNTQHGVELSAGAHDNLVGGNRLAGEGNILSGNRNHGLVITSFAHHNQVAGNIIGPDATGTYFLGNQPWGGVDISDGAHHNIIGGWDTGQGNLVSGNPTDGIALFQSNADPPVANELLYNIIGLTLDDDPLPNGGSGILNGSGAAETSIQLNTVAHNTGYGIVVANCNGHVVSRNSLYNNVLGGIRNEGNCVMPPVFRVASVGASDVVTVTGTTIPLAHVEIFSDDDGQARVYEGEAKADIDGRFTLRKPDGFAGPSLTATARDANGNTSELSTPVHLAWTVLLYLNGDNDLDLFMRDTVSNTVAAGPSPRANVLALMDTLTNTVGISGTVLYDLTEGQATVLPIMDGERNMGHKQTLIDFVTVGRDYYPSHHTLLAIVDHGGGWAPDPQTATGTQIHQVDWLAGVSGLSWDFSSDYDYLNSQEVREAMTAITGNGDRKLDVVYYDVCLMGMVEVAYELRDYASYFVSSQNIGWAPLGPQSRYVRAIQHLPANTSGRQMAELLVQAYADSLPLDEHPYTVSAVDLASMPGLAGDVSNLANAIRQTLTGPSQAAQLRTAYLQAQKIDYDIDFSIEPDTDGFVDLYDFARKAALQYPGTPISAAAQALMARLDAAIVAERHRSDHAWVEPRALWSLDAAHGLSIFLPLGEDLELVFVEPDKTSIQASEVVTRFVPLRDLYTGEQLQFVGDTTWKALIDTYYDVAASPVPTITTTGPISGVIAPDITPPTGVITVSGSLAVGQPIQVAWTATDAQSGVAQVTIWHQSPARIWTPLATQPVASLPVASGVLDFTPDTGCRHRFAVQAIDSTGNVEPWENGPNNASVFVVPCRIIFPEAFRSR